MNSLSLVQDSRREKLRRRMALAVCFAGALGLLGSSAPKAHAVCTLGCSKSKQTAIVKSTRDWCYSDCDATYSLGNPLLGGCYAGCEVAYQLGIYNAGKCPCP